MYEYVGSLSMYVHEFPFGNNGNTWAMCTRVMCTRGNVCSA